MSPHRATATLLAPALILALAWGSAGAAAAAPQPQLTRSGIAGYPSSPSPSGAFDWAARAHAYDEFVYDWADRGPYTTISTDASALNMPSGQSTYKLPAYYGDRRVAGTAGDGNQEALNQIASVVGASLVGIDKSDQDGRDYVDMLRTFYHPELGVAKNTPSSSPDAPGSNSIWYTTTANVLYYMLGARYPDATDMTPMLQSIADEYYDMVVALGGVNADFAMQDYDFSSDRAVTGRNEGGEAAVGAATILLWANAKFGDVRYLQAAAWAMDALQRSGSNLYYEMIPLLAPYIAARLNAETNSNYDIQKYLGWLMQDSAVRGGWGTISGNWGGKDVYGLSGSRTDTGGYAFAMNSFATPLLAATAKYDSRFANVIGRWMLNVDNAARFFYADQMPASEQYYGDRFAADPAHVIAYEGLMKTGPRGIQARGDIPERSGSWGVGDDATSLGLYGSSWVGFMGAALEQTDVPNVIRTDLNALDFFGDNSHPTHLYFNPHDTDATVTVDLADSHDLYDSVTDEMLATAVSGTVPIVVPAHGSVVLVELPPHARRGIDGAATTFDGASVAYDRSPTRNLALGGTADASSTAVGAAAAAIDGSPTTHWSPAPGAASLTVDLGGTYDVSEVGLSWGADHARRFEVSTSLDGQTWSAAATVDDGRGGEETVSFSPADARFLRVQLTSEADHPVSVREIAVRSGDLAAQKPVAVSSSANTTNIAEALTDGSRTTRWESAASDPQWAAIDLGAEEPIGTVTLSWEAAAARSFAIQVSDDGTEWSTQYATSTSAGGEQSITLPDGVTGRYVRLFGTERLTRWAYSLFSFGVYHPEGDRSTPVLYGPEAAVAGDTIEVTGRGFSPDELVDFSWDSLPGVTTARADGAGSLTERLPVPAAGAQRLTGRGQSSLSSSSLDVVVSEAPPGTVTPPPGTDTPPPGGDAPATITVPRTPDAPHPSALAGTGFAVDGLLTAGVLALLLALTGSILVLRRRRPVGSD